MLVKLHSPTAQVPVRKTTGSAGYDLFADIYDPVVIHANDEPVEIETNISVKIPNGYVGIIKPRSGLAFNDSIDTMAGVIDSDYRGKIKLLLVCHGGEGDYYNVNSGQRIEQMIVIPHLSDKFEVVTDLESETERGENGFGSTGNN